MIRTLAIEGEGAVEFLARGNQARHHAHWVAQAGVGECSVDRAAFKSLRENALQLGCWAARGSRAGAVLPAPGKLIVLSRGGVYWDELCCSYCYQHPRTSTTAGCQKCTQACGPDPCPVRSRWRSDSRACGDNLMWFRGCARSLGRRKLVGWQVVCRGVLYVVM
jgi:hypothetical protein